MKIAIAQINTTVGDLSGNVARILDAARSVASQKPDLVVFPELTVCGYPPRDILYDSSFVEAVQHATLDLARQAEGLPPLLVGSFAPAEQKLYQHPSLNNVAYLMQDGEMKVAQIKQLLPVYDVFYEPRWFLAGTKTLPPLEIAGKKVGVMICEDMWDEEYPIHPGADLKAMGAELLICISASPYRRGAGEGRLRHAMRQVIARPSTTGFATNASPSAQGEIPFVFVNLVGANDELIFDGGSFVVGGERLAKFEEEVRLVEVGEERGKTKDSEWNPSAGSEQRVESGEEEVFKALALGLRDFANKNNLSHAFIGLSGGIDSSVVAVIAAEALGRERVTGVAIPSRFTDVRSTESARELASRLGIGFEVVELETMHKAAEQAVGPKRSEGVGGENIQARLRMIVLMSFVNQRGGFLINTSNKTELTLGYSTLYGDMAGAISPLGDLTKSEVYALARWINVERDIISPYVMSRKPSAELRADQVDPFDYSTISPEAEALVRSNQSNAAMRTSEHKRWQMGLVLKVSEKSFGRGRLMPITRR